MAQAALVTIIGLASGSHTIKLVKQSGTYGEHPGAVAPPRIRLSNTGDWSASSKTLMSPRPRPGSHQSALAEESVTRSNVLKPRQLPQRTRSHNVCAGCGRSLRGIRESRRDRPGQAAPPRFFYESIR